MYSLMADNDLKKAIKFGSKGPRNWTFIIFKENLYFFTLLSIKIKTRFIMCNRRETMFFKKSLCVDTFIENVLYIKWFEIHLQKT